MSNYTLPSVSEDDCFYDMFDREYIPWSSLKRKNSFPVHHEAIYYYNDDKIIYFGTNGKLRCLVKSDLNTERFKNVEIHRFQDGTL